MPEIVEPAIPVEYRKDIALLWVRGREGSGTLIGLESPDKAFGGSASRRLPNWKEDR